MPVSWLKEPHAYKNAFFEAVADVDGEGRALNNWRVSFRSFPQSKARADECLARAKRRPRWFGSRWLKLAFLKGRYNYSRRYFRKRQDHIALCWQGLTGARRAFMLGAIDAGADTLFAEIAPFQGYKTLDPLGVNAEGCVPQNRADFDHVAARPELLELVKNGFQSRASRRSDVGQTDTLSKNAGNFVFVPLQVPNDSQLILFSDWVGSAKEFINALALASQELPDGWHFRLKEHPSSKIKLTDHINKAIKSGARMVCDNQTDSFAQLEAAKAVLTVNSSMGLQAMFYGKPVITTGRAFYALPGLTSHASSQKRLNDISVGIENIQFDQSFRERFLSWLLTEYYIAEADTGYNTNQLTNRIAEARA